MALSITTHSIMTFSIIITVLSKMKLSIIESKVKLSVSF